MKRATFCTCDDTSCPLNPSNHDQGCDLCVEDSLKTREIPKCFFLATGNLPEDNQDWSFESFARIVNDK
jgi:hypothetical protein